MRKVPFAPVMFPGKGDTAPLPWEHHFAEELPALILPGSVGGVLLGKEHGREGEKELGVGFAEEGAGIILCHQVSSAQVLEEATLHQVTKVCVTQLSSMWEIIVEMAGHSAESRNHNH